MVKNLLTFDICLVFGYIQSNKVFDLNFFLHEQHFRYYRDSAAEVQGARKVSAEVHCDRFENYVIF